MDLSAAQASQIRDRIASRNMSAAGLAVWHPRANHRMRDQCYIGENESFVSHARRRKWPRKLLHTANRREFLLSTAPLTGCNNAKRETCALESQSGGSYLISG